MKIEFVQIIKKGINLRLSLDDDDMCSIFKNVESWIWNEEESYKIIEHVSKRLRQDGYRCMIDFLFCNMFPVWKKECFKFYQGQGDKLKDCINDDQRLIYEAYMIFVLTAAKLHYIRNTKISWNKLMSQCKEWPHTC